jgi:hypothetical protein
MHKLLAGLVTAHELLRSQVALRVAVRLAEHLRTRVHRILAKGLDVWHDFINQEVGGMSEALADLARVTGNSTWLQLAGMFERPCFVGPLARGAPADAIERVHANTHLPQLLGAMARYEATGERALKLAAEHFWEELHSKHTFATGSSTSGEVWLRAGQLGDAVAHQRKDNYWAHDQAETCVAHNSMRVSRRLLQWSPRGAWARKGAHAAYYERTLYNAVLGTQRGTRPGQMLYMFPMGGGVSKAGIPNAPQGHHWSDSEHHFWCCQGSGIEAFARLADAIYWRTSYWRLETPPPPAADPSQEEGRAEGRAASRELLVLQLLPSALQWRDAGLRAEIRGDYPGSLGGGLPLRVRASFARLETHAADGGGGGGGGEVAAANAAHRLDVWLRLPEWATRLSVDVAGGLTTTVAAPAAGQMLPLTLSAGAAAGHVDVKFTPATGWERIKDSRPHFASLHAALYGPLVLGGLTYAERALPLGAVLTPVPSSEPARIASVRVITPGGGKKSGGASEGGCLVSRWQSGWVIRPDTTRHFLLRPAAECLARATPIEDDLSRFAQAAGGGKGYALDAAQTREACARLDGCILPEGRSAFHSGRLVMMHLGANAPVVLAAPPPTVEGTRRGGTDAANAASWRLTDVPVGMPRPEGASSSGAFVYLESFDTPGYVLAPAQAAQAHGTLTLVRASASDMAQRWRRAPHGSAKGRGGEEDEGTELLQSLAPGGRFLAVRRRDPTVAGEPVLVVPHRAAAISREWELVLSDGADGAAPLAFEKPYAEYAPASFWLHSPPAAAAAAATTGEKEPPGVRPFLLMPLNAMVDEHYTVYFCRPSTEAEAKRPPRHCV